MRLGKTEDARRELETFQRQQAEAETAGQLAFQLDALRREASKSLLAGSFDQAIASYEEALKLDPSSARSHRDLGLALLRAKRPQRSHRAPGCRTAARARRSRDLRISPMRTSLRAIATKAPGSVPFRSSSFSRESWSVFGSLRGDGAISPTIIGAIVLRVGANSFYVSANFVACRCDFDSATAILVRAPTRVQLVAPTIEERSH